LDNLENNVELIVNDFNNIWQFKQFWTIWVVLDV
jgi:hypothetical protein